MPLVRISLAGGKPEDHRRTVAAGVHRALVETFGVAEQDHLQVLTDAAAEAWRYDPRLAGLERSAELVLIQVTAADTRGVAQKRAFYRRVVELLGAAPGIRSDDILVCLVDAPRENWFLGNAL
jgi:4-oxalocrotonate tautomerase